MKGKSMILHFDGKIVQDYTDGKRLVRERVAVSINLEKENTLLGIPFCTDSTGESQSEAIKELIVQYELKDKIKGLVFDTTSTNTGKENGVCARISNYLQQPILYLACRHHVYECHIKNVSKIYRKTCGPEHPLFKRLYDEWPNITIDQSRLTRYTYGESAILDFEARSSLDFLKLSLRDGKIPLGNYRELAELVIFFLSPNSKDLKIRMPGAISHARFMSQAIYFMKLKIMNRQLAFINTNALKCEINEMSEFIALFYAKWFIRSSVSKISPRVDLESIWEMKGYRKIRPEISNKCIASISNHLWYLHPTVIPFCLLDENVIEKEKREVCSALLNIMGQKENSIKYEKIKMEPCINIKKKVRPSLSKFIDKSSLLIFDILGHDSERLEWLQLPSKSWPLMSAFREFRDFVKNIPVVNDSAERNVALLKSFISTSTDESLRQDLFLSIEKKRKDDKKRRDEKKIKNAEKRRNEKKK